MDDQPTSPQPVHDRIVVGVDGSEGSRHAIDWAIDEAAHRKATLELVHVWSTPVAIAHMGAVILPEDHEAYQASAHRLIDPVVDATRAAADAVGVPVEAVVTEGHPTTELLERHEHADLLVVGGRGHTGISGLILGSVSDQCSHHATRPVAIVPRTAEIAPDGDVVVGVDGSEHSYIALRWAVDEAGRRGARLVALHAWWTPVAVPPVGIAVTTEDRDEFLDDTNRMLHELVDGIVARAEHRPAAVELVPVEQPAAEAMVERSHGAAVTVVGSRGRGGFAGLLLGSVSRQVLHHAASTVVVVR